MTKSTDEIAHKQPFDYYFASGVQSANDRIVIPYIRLQIQQKNTNIPVTLLELMISTVNSIPGIVLFTILIVELKKRQ